VLSVTWSCIRPSATYYSSTIHPSILLHSTRQTRPSYIPTRSSISYNYQLHQIYVITIHTTTMLLLAPLALLLTTTLAAPQNPSDITGLLTGALTGLRCVDPNINFLTCRALGGYPDVDITMETCLKLCRCNAQNWVQCEGIEKTRCDGDLVTSICRCSREWVVDLDADKGCGAPCQCAP
jgi:hypothetical protein